MSLEELKIGEVRTFSIKKKMFKITGEIREIKSLDGRTFVSIYQLFNRAEKLFLIDENCHLIELKKRKRKYLKQNIRLSEDFDNKNQYKTINKIISKILILIIILSILLTINPQIRLPTKKIEYQVFLERKYKLPELLRVVNKNILYQYDLNEYWYTPENAWKMGRGDCEEMSAIISDYLNHHNIENYLAGLSIKKSNQGHAVVFTKYKGDFFILDATGAVEKEKLKLLSNVSTIIEAVKVYDNAIVPIFSVPKYNGNKNVVEWIK